MEGAVSSIYTLNLNFVEVSCLRSICYFAQIKIYKSNQWTMADYIIQKLYGVKVNRSCILKFDSDKLKEFMDFLRCVTSHPSAKPEYHEFEETASGVLDCTL